MATRIQLRGDTAANWASNNPTLAAREFAVETDTLRIKVGNGSDAYNTLQYASVPAYNGLDKAVAGNSLDARQGKVLYDTKAPINNPIFTGKVKVPPPNGDDQGFQALPKYLLDDRVPHPNSSSSGKYLQSNDDGTAEWANPLSGPVSLSTRIANVGPILDSDSVLFGNTTWSIKLPAAASNSGRVLRLICNSASTPYVFNPGQSDSIIKKDGSVITFPSMLEIAAPYGSVTLIRDGISKWYSI